MVAWRRGLGVWLLTLGVGVGCGGPLPEQGEDGLPVEDALVGEQETEASALSCYPIVVSTQRVKSILPPTGDYPPRLMPVPEDFVAFQGHLFFAANPDEGPGALWRSDGTSVGTVVVKSIPSTGDVGASSLRQLTSASSRLFFVAADAAHGSELWTSNGTSSGTRLVKDLTPGAEGSSLAHLTALGGRLVFFREVYSSGDASSRQELWTSDGTSAGTVRLRAFAPELGLYYETVSLGGALLFFTRDEQGVAVWRTDGTAEGTVRLKRVEGEGSWVAGTRLSGGRAFFLVRTAGGQTTVWGTDGSAAGTRKLHTEAEGSTAHLLGVLGNQLYLTSTSEATQRMTVVRIPVEGGASATVMVLPNDYTNQGEALPFVSDVGMAAGGRKVYFIVTIGSAGPAPRDTQLWVTDGTGAGTKLLRRPLSLSDEYGSPLTVVADELVFFSAFEASSAGIEPWVTNGTPGGTRRLKDIVPGPESSYPREFVRVGPQVFFSTVDATRGGQLWSSLLLPMCGASALSLEAPPEE